MSTENKVEETIEAGAQVSLGTKNQKKAIKSFKGTGVKKVNGIHRAVIRKRDGMIIYIENPEVYRTPNGSYLLFGEPKVQDQADLTKQISELTAGEKEADKSPEAIQADLAKAAEQKETPAEEEKAIPDEEVNTEGLDPANIQIIMDQANIPKYKAVSALRKHNGDVVNTLMELTS